MSERDDKYRLVQQRRTEVPIGPGEVRITQSGRVRHYITYALRCFRESASPFVTLRAMGRAISKAVSVAEVLKRRVAGLHQVRNERLSKQRRCSRELRVASRADHRTCLFGTRGHL
mmetsp:Transcript_10783/g.40475  ORF Transcript_10783/g.40475 Transcript_10783/m.40475 type:complete len:116 (+) Transcript_10783:68-415(+)|eukprot:scaffold149_cov315-Pinguiococcus_pyrenoidosus.AAC.47